MINEGWACGIEDGGYRSGLFQPLFMVAHLKHFARSFGDADLKPAFVKIFKDDHIVAAATRWGQRFLTIKTSECFFPGIPSARLRKHSTSTENLFGRTEWSTTSPN
jgi:hypothetical protein